MKQKAEGEASPSRQDGVPARHRVQGNKPEENPNSCLGCWGAVTKVSGITVAILHNVLTQRINAFVHI